MNINHIRLRQLFKSFWKKHDHKEIPPIPLVPKDDPTTLFTGSGMQPLIPYLLGEPHPLGKRLYDIQPCLRAQDIEEVGDSSHDTFFEMMGNWSLGDYFKKEQLAWFWEFLTKELKLPKEKLYVTIFEGTKEIPADDESYEIWKNLGIPENHIFKYGADINWWSRAGAPDKMPAGEPGGPDSEVFYEFTDVAHDKKFGEKCHPNCQCGRFLEIGNSVFIQYKKNPDGTFSELPAKNVDFGGGVERAIMAIENEPDMFKTTLFDPMIRNIESVTGKSYNDEKNKPAMRIIADHLKASVFLINDGVLPSNKEQGYILRRLIRRAALKMKNLIGDINSPQYFTRITNQVVDIYKNVYFKENDKENISKVIRDEIDNFTLTINTSIKIALDELESLQKIIDFIKNNKFVNNLSLLFTQKGVIDTYVIQDQRDLINELIEIAKRSGKSESFLLSNRVNEKINISSEDKKRFNEILNYFKTNKITLNSKWAFRFITSYGISLEILIELLENKNISLDLSTLDNLLTEHRNLSRRASTGKFKGGLADQSEHTVKYHTATHLIHQALFDVLGNDIRQEGSNITSERLRFDFYSTQKPTDEQIKKVELIVNEKINQAVEVSFKIIPKDEALKISAKSFFREKYPEMVKVYFINDYSREFCAGSHVKNTKEIGSIKIFKFEKIGSNLYRIYAK